MMNRKGFTLIELIVVIAIIGVLAMILVPTMLGYIKKSKISSANASASLMYKAINSVLLELDSDGYDIGGSYMVSWSDSTKKWTATGAKQSFEDDVIDTGKFEKRVRNFFESIDKVKKCEVAMCEGVCAAVSIARDSTYVGTYPAGVITTENYTSYVPTTATALNSALADAMIIYFGGTLTSSGSTSAINTATEKGFTVNYVYNGKSTIAVT